ncbi:MAG: flagellar hook capping protein [Firmicutes bacterium]|nr:flagellar hook capping protein [Bacillota bacterium]
MDVKATNNDYYLPKENTREPKQTLDKDAFLRIMIEQLKNQDPTSPMESDKFINQMAQFTTLEQLTNMNENIEGMSERFNTINSTFTDMLKLQQINQGASLIGNVVSLGEGVTGTVEKVLVEQNAVKVLVDGNKYDIEEITTVEAKPEPQSEG